MNRAIFSDDGKHRYLLERDVAGVDLHMGDTRTLSLIMVNPSKAGAEVNDPTIVRVMGLSRVAGLGRVLVGNEFSHVATDIKELREAHLPSGGATNDAHLASIMAEGNVLAFGWGPLAKLPKHLRLRWKRVYEMACDMHKQPMCWGTAGDGHPRHPLFVPYHVPLQPWSAPR